MTPEKLFETAVNKQLEHDLEGAKKIYKRLLQKFPSQPDVLANLGVIARRQGQLDAADELLQRSLRAHRNNPPALATLANLRLSQHRYDEAHDLAMEALQLAPRYPEAIVNLGAAFAKRGQMKKAEAAFRTALSIAPQNAAARMNLANCFRMQKVHVDESIRTLETLEKFDPNNDELMMCLAMAYMEARQYARGLKYAERAYEISQKFEYVSTMAQIQIILGEFEEAMDRYKIAMKFDPNNREVAATMLFALNYDDRLSAEQVFGEYRKYAASLSQRRTFTHENHPAVANRRIRVGYVSADFYCHVVMYFMEPILRCHDRTKFEIFAYSGVANEDEVSARAKKLCDHWITTVDMTDEELAERVRADGIDVLIDLSGHTTGNRLRMMAYHPAPAQATYLGYGYTTGMSEIDYFIGDENFTPEGCEHLFSEKIIRVPAPVYAYTYFNSKMPDVQPPPVLEKGYITFGSMSRIVRLNNRLLKTWLRILDAVPGSKLRLDQKPFGDPETCERFLARVERLGYSRDQIELTSSSPHFEGYNHFDISLDCWPHNAGTTTFEALMMGVPVISKRDRPSVGRLSEMILKPLGLDDWIVDTEDQFVETAIRMAADTQGLVEWRARLRPLVEESPFSDAKARALGLERAYEQMMANFEKRPA